MYKISFLYTTMKLLEYDILENTLSKLSEMPTLVFLNGFWLLCVCFLSFQNFDSFTKFLTICAVSR